MKMKLHKLHFKNYSVKLLNVTQNVKVVTRILKVGPRRGDGAESVIIELVD